MTAIEARAEIFVTAFRSLSKGEKIAVIKKLLTDKHFMQDLMDAAIIQERLKESSRPLKEYIASRKKTIK
jgi:tRNA A-37 threonylcarbamoyl transferase component Bud32